jgi:hypothetical protein
VSSGGISFDTLNRFGSVPQPTATGTEIAYTKIAYTKIAYTKIASAKIAVANIDTAEITFTLTKRRHHQALS